MSAQNQDPIRAPSGLLLIHHMANRDHQYPPGTIPALRDCLEAGARAVEIDISLLADGQFALLHGPQLEGETTGSGLVQAHTSEQVRDLRYIYQGKVVGVTIGFLPEALELLSQYPDTVELQLDLKPDVYPPDDALFWMATSLQLVKDRVRVTSPSDWAIRRLHTFDPDLPLGFDPLLYIEADLGEGHEPGMPPFRQGAYGYWDDHPLASQRWGSTGEYLAARAEALYAQVPAGIIWYIHAWLLGKALDDGFDWVAYLHAHNSLVDAWTLDANQPEHVALARRLISHGLDRVTTDNTPYLAQALGLAAG